jgi:hypothetical protein
MSTAARNSKELLRNEVDIINARIDDAEKVEADTCRIYLDAADHLKQLRDQKRHLLSTPPPPPTMSERRKRDEYEREPISNS